MDLNSLNKKELELVQLLQSLERKLNQDTYLRYKRINPFLENLFSWKAKGKFWTGRKNVTIYNSATVVGSVEIGDHTWVGPYVSLDGTGNLKIGKYCSISSGSMIITHDTAKWCVSGGKEAYEYAPTIINDYCFVGTYATITKGVTIGAHSIIGAGAVVTQSFPDFSIVTGVPAKLTGKVIIDKNGKVNFIWNNKNQKY